jgi:hypothetical protein
MFPPLRLADPPSERTIEKTVALNFPPPDSDLEP